MRENHRILTLENLQTSRKVLQTVIAKCNEELKKRNQAREEAIKLSRDVLRVARTAIAHIHVGDLNKASENISQLRNFVRNFLTILEPYPDLSTSGFAYNAICEYVEAVTLYNIVTNRPLPSPEELNVSCVPYIQGLGDLIGELRRLILDLIRRNKADEVDSFLSLMEVIYTELLQLHFPEALIPGIKHKIDTARKLIDDTKTIVTMYHITRRISPR